MSHIDCRQCERRLSAFIDGELAPHEARRVADHIAECASCREALEDERSLAGQVAGLSAPEPRSDAIHRLHARLETAPTVVWRPAPYVFAAAVLVMVAAYIVARPNRPWSSSPPVTTAERHVQTRSVDLHAPRVETAALPAPAPEAPVDPPVPSAPGVMMASFGSGQSSPAPRVRRPTRPATNAPRRSAPRDPDESIIVTTVHPPEMPSLEPGTTVLITDVPADDGGPASVWSVKRTVGDDNRVDHIEIRVEPEAEEPPQAPRPETSEDRDDATPEVPEGISTPGVGGDDDPDRGGWYADRRTV